MFDRLLAIIAPHHCSGCGKIGQILCQKCKNYITNRPYTACVVCHAPSGVVNLCSRHRLPYRNAWCVAERTDTVQKLIDQLKFERKRATYSVLAELLDERLPELPRDTHIVPIPTAPRNIRRRGYDHMLLIARALARCRNMPVTPLLVRRNNVTQHFAPDAKARRQQAKEFFALSRRFVVDPKANYLLIDDIFTSGATLGEAAKLLRQAGAKQIDIAIIARQRDKTPQ